MRHLPWFLLLGVVSLMTSSSGGAQIIGRRLVTRKLGSMPLTAPNTNIPKRKCGTGSPSPALLGAHKHLRSVGERKFNPHGIFARASPQTTQFQVPTVFHIVSTSDMQHFVTPSMIANQFGALQAGYAQTNISFRLVNVTRSVNDGWATDDADADMKVTLRQGDYGTLNIYFQSNLSTFAYGDPSQLLGYCTLPTNVTYSPCDDCDLQEYPASVYHMDGCNVLAGSMPGGYVSGYNLGRTAVHEVGHWFGLMHVFQNITCDPADPGDYIDDTPKQSVSTDGCPVGKDSCPLFPGVDSIHNFMDYSVDHCYESFTPNQITRMHNMFQSFRNGR